METIRILIYTDYEEISENPKPYSWGITELEKFLVYKTQNIAAVKVSLCFRFASKDNPQRLTTDFLSNYDQLWVLCFNSEKEDPYQLSVGEIDALYAWMNKDQGRGGGLLVAGDHAAGFCDTGDPKTFGAHGRSLGESMKRAGQLRVWQGPPTACLDKPLNERDNFNTCYGSDPATLDNPDFQSDGIPLRLLTPRGTPHRLFWWNKDARGGVTLIERLPDHQHEGKLVIPNPLDNEWPPNSPPPVVAAMARDQRFPAQPRDYALVVAYDGDAVDVGRIVADSSFHHYLNINLFKIPERDATGYPKAGSDLDQIAQFYGNLALWLTPKNIRTRIKSDVFFRIAADPDVFEVRGSSIETLAMVAEYAIALRIGEVDLQRLIAVTELDTASDDLDRLYSVILLGAEAILSKREQTIMLGGIIQAYHTAFAKSGAVTPGWLDMKPDPLQMIIAGAELASVIESSITDKLAPLF